MLVGEIKISDEGSDSYIPVDWNFGKSDSSTCPCE